MPGMIKRNGEQELFNIDSYNPSTLKTRNSVYNYIIPPKTLSKSYGCRSFTEQVKKEWYLLPQEIRELKPSNKFKKELSKVLLNVQKEECKTELCDFSHYDETIIEVIKYWC